MDIDDVYNEFAEFGRYQKHIFVHLTVFQTFLALHQVHNVFVGATPEFVCDIGKRRLIEGCPSRDSTPCVSYEFTGDFTSIASEWNIVCDDAYKLTLVQSIYMAGIFVGSFLFGKLADKHGRKPMLCISAIGMALFSLGGMTSQSYEMYVTMRFVTAVFNGGAGLVSFVLLSELIGSSKRSLAGVLVPTCFGLGIALFALLAHVFRDWRMLTLVCSLPGFVGVYWYRFLPESPRWLYSQQRVTDAERLLHYIITSNGGPLPAKPITLKDTSSPSASSRTQAVGSQSQGFALLFREPLLRRLTLFNAFIWFMNCCAYYGLTMGAGNLGGNMYMSVALSGLVEMPAYLTTLYLIESRLGRRLSISWVMLFGGVVCALMLTLPPELGNVRTSVALLGKMAVSISFSIAWLYSAELYPTFIRNQGVSVCTGTARVGGVISPFLLQLGKLAPNCDYFLFGMGLFLSGLLALKLPETHKQPMPESIEDLYDLAGRGHSSRGQYKVTISELAENKVNLLRSQLDEHTAEAEVSTVSDES